MEFKSARTGLQNRNMKQVQRNIIFLSYLHSSKCIRLMTFERSKLLLDDLVLNDWPYNETHLEVCCCSTLKTETIKHRKKGIEIRNRIISPVPNSRSLRRTTDCIKPQLQSLGDCFLVFLYGDLCSFRNKSCGSSHVIVAKHQA